MHSSSSEYCWDRLLARIARYAVCSDHIPQRLCCELGEEGRAGYPTITMDLTQQRSTTDAALRCGRDMGIECWNTLLV